MESSHKVFVGGSAMTKFGEISESGLIDLFGEIITKTLKDSGDAVADIEAVYVANMLGASTENLQHLGAQITPFLGRSLPIYSFEAACASGGMAIHAAWKDIAAGHYKKVLVVGAEKMTEQSPNEINDALMRATNQSEQMSGISFAGLYGLIAQKYLSEYTIADSELENIPLLLHRNSQTNPYAQFQGKISREIIANSRLISSPLRLFDCAPLTDGAAGVVLQSAPTDVCILKSSLATTSPSIADRSSLISFPSTKQALAQLNLSDNWQDNLKVLEAHDCFSISLLIALEDLGLAEPGKGLDIIKKSLNSSPELNYIINPSGGLKACGHPVGATGIKQIHSVAQYLETQSPGDVGLTHNLGGTGGTAVIHYLEKIAS